MADQRPLIRDPLTGTVSELTDSDSLLVGGGLAPNFLDMVLLTTSQQFNVGDNGFTVGSV